MRANSKTIFVPDRVRLVICGRVKGRGAELAQSIHRGMLDIPAETQECAGQNTCIQNGPNTDRAVSADPFGGSDFIKESA